MLNRPKARTRGYSCPLDENVARSILHKTIAIESKMIHQSYQTAQNEVRQGFRKKNEPEPKNGSSPTASSQWFGEQCESEPNAQGALTKPGACASKSASGALASAADLKAQRIVHDHAERLKDSCAARAPHSVIPYGASAQKKHPEGCFFQCTSGRTELTSYPCRRPGPHQRVRTGRDLPRGFR